MVREITLPLIRSLVLKITFMNEFPGRKTFPNLLVSGMPCLEILLKQYILLPGSSWADHTHSAWPTLKGGCEDQMENRFFCVCAGGVKKEEWLLDLGPFEIMA